MWRIPQQFIEGLAETTTIEYMAVFAGILSVWFSKKEIIWVYPVGLINTVTYVYLSFRYHLIGEASVNLFYTIMSIYGWVLWSRRDSQNRKVVQISFSNSRDVAYQLLFFLFVFAVYYFSLVMLQKGFAKEAIPFGDAFATGAAFTGMWLMARKKVESWWWWIVTNIASIPLFFVKGLVVTSVYFFILLVMAIFGLAEWKRRAKSQLLTLPAHEEDHYPGA